jgi:hypothetical protein
LLLTISGTLYRLEVRREGVSGYVEAFLLIGVAIGGSGIVLDAAMRYASSAQGSSLAVSGATITQGPYLAVERLMVSNVGHTSVGALTVSTQPVVNTAVYCYSLLNPATLKLLLSTCPEMEGNPGLLVIASGLSSGESLLIELVVTGQTYAPGSDCLVAVSDEFGDLQSLTVEVGRA